MVTSDRLGVSKRLRKVSRERIGMKSRPANLEISIKRVLMVVAVNQLQVQAVFSVDDVCPMSSGGGQ